MPDRAVKSLLLVGACMVHKAAESQRSTRLGNVPALVRLVSILPASADPDLQQSTARKRRMVAELCRLMGAHIYGAPLPPAAISAPMTGPRLAPRVRQTLAHLLAGDSEKQIALRLGLSRHTVHCYVKSLYRRYGVCSRGELLSRFVHSSAR